MAGASIVLAAWLILQWGILPRAESWKPELERWATAALGVPVRAGAIEVGGGMWSPMLTLRDLELLGPDGQPALQLGRVRAVLAPRSLIPRSLVDWTPHFEQILIDAPALEVRRDADDTLWVAGIALRDRGSERGSSPAADWLFRQREVVVRNGDVRWVDTRRGAAPLHLRDVQLLLRNDITRHRLRLDATPPDGWGQRFAVRGDFRGSLLTVTGLQGAGDWQRWRGQVQVDLPLIDIEQLGGYVTLPWHLRHGRSRLAAWFEIDRNALTGASADVALRDVSLKTGATAEPLQLQWLQTRLSFERKRSNDRTSTRLALQQLRFEADGGADWPAADLTVVLEQDGRDTVRGGSLEVSSIDLRRLADLADHMPLPRAWHEQLDGLHARGVVEGLQLRWQGPLDAWHGYAANGRVRGLGVAALAAEPPADGHRAPPGRPGFDNLDGRFEFTERGGRISARIQDGTLVFPGVFEEAEIPVTDLQTELRWQRDQHAGRPPDYSVELASLKLANADLQGQFQGRWQTGAGSGSGHGGYLPGKLDLKARLQHTRLERVARYLPLAIGEDTRHYLRDALLAGHVPVLTAQVKGDLHDFPFERDGSGEFKLRATIEQARYAYVPPRPDNPAHWPMFTALRTELVIDRHRLLLQNGSAKLGESGEGRYGLTQVQGRIDNYLHAPVLAIQGNGQGPLADALQYVNRAPVGEWIGRTLASTRASGDAALQLALRIPLQHSRESTVRGSVLLNGNDLAMTPDVPLLAGTRGRVDFTEKGFSVTQASARAVGGTLAFEGAQQADGSVRFSGNGTASADGLRRTAELPWLANLGRLMGGQTPYRLQLGFVHGQTELTVQSPLTGMALKLPAPLAKTEAETLPLKVSLQPQSTDAAGAPIDLLRIELGKLMDAQYLRRHPPTGTDGPVQVARGAIGLGQAPPEWPAQGVVAQLAWPRVSVDDWVDWARRNEAEARASAPPGASAEGERNDYLPTRLQLRTAELWAGGRKLDKVKANLSREPGPPPRVDAWLIDVEAEQLAGRIELQGPGFGTAHGAAAVPHQDDKVTARLTRLAIPRSEVSAIGERLDTTEEELPALDVVVERFDLHGQPLGRLELQAANQSTTRTGEARIWRIGKLLVAGNEAQLQASGQWVRRGGGNPSQTALDFKLDIRDAGQLLERLGMEKAVRGGHGALNGEVRWRGAPLAFDWATLGGNLHLEVERGQFLQADAGAAKLLGILSLQSLPRRLLLDFRDLIQSGFPFDRVDGDIGIDRGQASTRNLRVRGVQALILTEGSADLVKETQDLHVWVVPQFNAGAASLAYAVVNPAVGLGTLLGQLFLSRQLAEATTREFHVTGKWDTPDVAPVARRRPPRDDTATQPPDANPKTP